MNYTNLKEENTNTAVIAGIICSGLKQSHQVEGENFFEFSVKVERLSKVEDIIPVTISERSIMGKDLTQGKFVQVSGEYRSYNKLMEEKSRLILHLFAKEVEVLQDSCEFKNEVKLTGFVCKEPIYRKTPFEREICDVLLAVNRLNYHKSDYVPCIMWGRNARFMANQTIGCKVEIVGRIQSREYVKSDAEGNSCTKTAYEVSCQRISVLSNLTNLSLEKNVDENKGIV